MDGCGIDPVAETIPTSQQQQQQEAKNGKSALMPSTIGSGRRGASAHLPSAVEHDPEPLALHSTVNENEEKDKESGDPPRPVVVGSHHAHHHHHLPPDDSLTTKTTHQPDAHALVLDRRDAIIPTENTLFVDLIESTQPIPRPGDTPVTRVSTSASSDHPDRDHDSATTTSDATRIDQPSSNEHASIAQSPLPPPVSSPRRHIAARTGSCIIAPSTSTDLPHSHQLRVAPSPTTSLAAEPVPMYITKSSVTAAAAANPMGSPTSTPRRSSLARLLNPSRSPNTRIHPVTVTYAPGPHDDGVNDSDDPDDVAPSPKASGTPSGGRSNLGNHGARGSTAGPLTPHTVQIAERKPATLHTQRSIYIKTQTSLSEMFERPTQSRNGVLVLRLVFICIILNIGVLAMETCDGNNYKSSSPGYPNLPGEQFYDITDFIFTMLFTIEFIGRMFARKCKKDVFTDLIIWIDFLALCPWYLQLMVTSAGHEYDVDEVDGLAHTIGLLRLLRVFRLGHILREYESMKILIASLKASIAPLLITMFFLFTLVMLLATAIFYAEPCYNMNTCAFTDIFNSAYFIMVTVATVGYGNQVPSTKNMYSMGVAFVAMVFGQLYLAMPLAIVGLNFQETHDVFQQSKRRKLRRHDTTLSPFDSTKLNRQAQRLCEIQYHLLPAWRIVQINLDKFLRKGHELTADSSSHGGTSGTGVGTGIGGDAAATSSKRGSGEVTNFSQENHLQAQFQRSSKLREAIDKLLVVHSEACTLLEVFVPHKRKPHGGDPTNMSSAGQGVFSQVYIRARRALAKTHFGSHEHGPPLDARTMSRTHRGRLWLALEVPDSSPLATAINRVMVGFALLSVWVFFCESLPELMRSGVETSSCRRVVEDYCSTVGLEVFDSGCYTKFVSNATVDWTTPLDFTCSEPSDHASCYGNTFNFGSLEAKATPCVDAFNQDGGEYICYRMQCLRTTATMVNMEPYWIYFEWCFGISFVSEMVLRFYASHRRHQFFRDVYNVVDILAVLPFGFEFLNYILFGVRPSYAIVATSPSFFSVIRVLKTMRILKLTRHFRGTQVLAQTAKEVWRQLLIPIFFLLTMCILAAAAYFEIERGTECFVGTECLWWKKELLTPELVGDLPMGKRILIQDTKPSTIVDMIRSTWLSAATFTTVGYGDVRPRTSFGRLFTMCIAVVGTIYTSMPITLVGGKFRSLYARHAEKQSVRRGGSSTSWKTKRNLVQRVHDDDSKDPAADPSKLPHLFKLTDEELQLVHQFQSMKRTFQNLKRPLDKFEDVATDMLQRGQLFTTSPPTPGSSSSSVSNTNLNGNFTRIFGSMDHAMEEKSHAILDMLLQFSGLVEKLQHAPPFFEAFLPEDTTLLHRAMDFDKLTGTDLKHRLLQTHHHK